MTLSLAYKARHNVNALLAGSVSTYIAAVHFNYYNTHKYSFQYVLVYGFVLAICGPIQVNCRKTKRLAV